MVNIKDKLYISTKSNKVIETDSNLSKKRVLKFQNDISRVVEDKEILNCISKDKIVYKYNTLNKKEHKTSIKFDISYIKKIENEPKYLIGTTDGKLMHTDLEFKPLRMFYGCTNKILDICDSFKDKMISADNNLVIIDSKSSKVKNINVGFANCLDLVSKKNILFGADTTANLYDIEKDKIVKSFNMEGYISCIRNINDKILIGCENGTLYVCKLNFNDIIIVEKIDLNGSINIIEVFQNKIFIAVGREELSASYSRNKKFHHALYKITIN
jgi:hypothetical protein